MRVQDSAFVLTGDFESFFDNLNHVHLMASLRSLFPSGRLPDDHYQVIKNILRYSCWPIGDLAARHELPWPVIDPAREKTISDAAIDLRFKSIRELNKLDVILPKSEFLANKSKVITSRGGERVLISAFLRVLLQVECSLTSIWPISI